jgi:hypothetical protein
LHLNLHAFFWTYVGGQGHEANADKVDMRVSPRRSVVASVAAGCCLAGAVIAGGYAASGALPWRDWPGSMFAGNGGEVRLATPAARADTHTLTLPARVGASRTEVIRLPGTRSQTTSSGAGTDRISRDSTPTRDRVEGTGSKPRRRATTSDPDTSSTTVPTTSTSTGSSTTSTSAPQAQAASPAASTADSQTTTTPAATARKVTLSDVSSTFTSAQDSESGQPELRVQMAVKGAADTGTAQNVALSLKLAPTDVAALRASQASTRLALETQVDVVDASVTGAGQPACEDTACLRVQLKVAQDTRPTAGDQPEVVVLDDEGALSNRVKVVLSIDAASLGRPEQSPSDGDAPSTDGAALVQLPLTSTSDGDSSSAPASDDTTVPLPDGTSSSPSSSPAALQVHAQLEVVDAPADTTGSDGSNAQDGTSDTQSSTSDTQNGATPADATTTAPSDTTQTASGDGTQVAASGDDSSPSGDCPPDGT